MIYTNFKHSLDSAGAPFRKVLRWFLQRIGVPGSGGRWIALLFTSTTVACNYTSVESGNERTTQCCIQFQQMFIRTRGMISIQLPISNSSKDRTQFTCWCWAIMILAEPPSQPAIAISRVLFRKAWNMCYCRRNERVVNTWISGWAPLRPPPTYPHAWTWRAVRIVRC